MCETRKRLTNEWNEAVQQMANLVQEMKHTLSADKEAFDILHRQVEVSRGAAEVARATLDIHRSEHGC